MSLGLYTYSAAYPVLGALKARALREDIVASMLKAGNAEDCVDFLSKVLGDEPGSTVPVEVEGWLWGKWERQGKELARFTRGKVPVFLQLFVGKSDVRKLKLKVRQIRAREGRGSDLPGGRAGVLIRDRKLADARTLNGVVRALSGTPLEGILRKALPALAGDGDLLPFDLTLETNYERVLATGLKGLGGEGRRARWELLDGIWGVRDFVKALRLRFGYGLEPQEVFHYIAFTSEEFGPSHYWEIMEGEEPEACAKLLPKGRLQAILARMGLAAMSVSELEVGARRYARQMSGVRQLGSPFALVTFLKYLVHQEVLIEDAITVLGAKRLEMAEDEVRPLLSFAPGG